MTPRIRPTARRDLTVIELDGEAVIYDEQREDLHHLNRTATLTFKLFDGSVTMRELALEISEGLGLPQADVERDVRVLQRRFRRAGLLER